MPKFKELPTDPEVLRKLLQRLKDKEMKLEADLAIKEYPELEDAITSVILSMASIKKLDSNLRKAKKPATKLEQENLLALMHQIEFYAAKLETLRSVLRDKGGLGAEKFAELQQNRNLALGQLSNRYEKASQEFKAKQIDLELLIPSIADFLVNPGGGGVAET